MRFLKRKNHEYLLVSLSICRKLLRRLIQLEMLIWTLIWTLIFFLFTVNWNIYTHDDELGISLIFYGVINYHLEFILSIIFRAKNTLTRWIFMGLNRFVCACVRACVEMAKLALQISKSNLLLSIINLHFMLNWEYWCASNAKSMNQNWYRDGDWDYAIKANTAVI